MKDKSSQEKLWVGRSDGSVSNILVEMGESIQLDKHLYKEDIRASLTHARVLKKANILSSSEFEKIKEGLQKIKREIEEEKFTWNVQLEDIHTNIEKRLIEIIGLTGKKLHTARSRNDQIAVDSHLYVRTASHELAKKTLKLCQTLLRRANENVKIIIPGYTHLQVAQPIRLSHYLLAHFWAFTRDLKRFYWANDSANALALGSGAFAGVNYSIDRELAREDLKFNSIYPNSIDAVSSRDHILDFLYSCSIFMLHASRIAEEIILWSSSEFAFLELSDSLSTGSSIMPQKKNPDLAELIRAKCARTQANLHNMMTNMKGLPLSYNRDLQEDRFPLLDSYKQVKLSTQALEEMLSSISFKKNRMKSSLENGFCTATDLADALVLKKKIPFREAHHLVGKLIKSCIEQNKNLDTINKKSREKIHLAFAEEAFYKSAIGLEESTDKKKSYGSTSLESQRKQLEEAEIFIKKWRKKEWGLPSYAL